MKKIFLTLAAITCVAASPAAAQQKAIGHKEIGVETSIPFADHGGIRNWTNGPFGTNTLYVQDRRQLWYQVELSGPCANDSFLTIAYETGATGHFDRFSRLWSTRDPQMRCSVLSVKTALPPEGQPGYVAPEKAGAAG